MYLQRSDIFISSNKHLSLKGKLLPVGKSNIRFFISDSMNLKQWTCFNKRKNNPKTMDK